MSWLQAVLHLPQWWSVCNGEEGDALVLSRLEYPPLHVDTDRTCTLVQECKPWPDGERREWGWRREGRGIASSPDHSQILSRSRGEKLGEGLESLLRHRPEMVDSVSTNWVHVTYWPSPPFPACDIVLIPGLLLIFLHGCKGPGDEARTILATTEWQNSGIGTEDRWCYTQEELNASVAT